MLHETLRQLDALGLVEVTVLLKVSDISASSLSTELESRGVWLFHRSVPDPLANLDLLL